MKRLSGNLTYANVMATVAVFLALGGGAMAATNLGKNSVGTKQLKKNSVTGAKVKRGTLTGANINLAKLGTVPSATNAASATTASTAGTANALAALEPIHLVGSAGQPPFLDGSSSIGSSPPFNFAPVGFYKDHDGIVHLEGAVKVGKEGEIPGLIFALPPGYRPASGLSQIFTSGEDPVIVFGSNASAEGHNLEGDVYVPSEEEVTLSGITFRAQS